MGCRVWSKELRIEMNKVVAFINCFRPVHNSVRFEEFASDFAESAPIQLATNNAIYRTVVILALQGHLAGSIKSLRHVSKDMRQAMDVYAIKSLRISLNHHALNLELPVTTTTLHAAASKWSTRLLASLLPLSPHQPSLTTYASIHETSTMTVADGLRLASVSWRCLSHLTLASVKASDLKELNEYSFPMLQTASISVISSPQAYSSPDELTEVMNNPSAAHWVASLTNLTARSRPTLISLSPLSQSRNIINLDLSFCPSIIDLSPLSNCTMLKDLRLISCHSIQDIGSLSHCTKLEHLDLSNCTGITNLDPLSKGMPRLTTLLIPNCSQIKDLSPLSSSSSILHLDISGLNSITNISPIASQSLVKLNLQACSSILDLSPLSDCTNLAAINLKGCSEQQDRSVLVSCEKLARVMLVGMNHMNGEVFAIQLFVWEGKLN